MLVSKNRRHAIGYLNFMLLREQVRMTIDSRETLLTDSHLVEQESVFVRFLAQRLVTA